MVVCFVCVYRFLTQYCNFLCSYIRLGVCVCVCVWVCVCAITIIIIIIIIIIIVVVVVVSLVTGLFFLVLLLN